MTVTMVPFNVAVADVSRGNNKLPQSQFLDIGRFPVVDQGQRLVSGYADEEALLCRVPGPVIVFGDHTRAFKYIDFPFVIGADGVKVLQAREGWDSKYLYHYLKSRDIPSAGYSRHFKFLKELKVPKPPLDEQRGIAAILDQVDAIRAKRCQALGQLDDLIQAIFRNMFGAESFMLVSASEIMPTMRNGVSPATGGEYLADVLTLSAVTRGAFNPAASKPGQFAVKPPSEKRVSRLDFLMCRGNGNKALVGLGSFSRDDRPDLVFPDTMIAGRVEPSMITLPFLEVAWRQPGVRRQIEALARTTNGTYKVNQQALSSVTMPLPPLPRQKEFGLRVERVYAQRAAVEYAAAKDDELMASIQSRAFRGGL